MPKRTSPDDARWVEDASDLEDIVQDKRAVWRATGAKARRRQRRYQKLILSHIEIDGIEDGSDDHGKS
ncbi:MAG: hypothetical protein AAFQ59_05770 [Pseudomonadota bacterium]